VQQPTNQPAVPAPTWRFNEIIDRQIAADTLNRGCDFEEVLGAVPNAEESSDYALGIWTPWRTDFCALSQFLAAPTKPVFPTEDTAYVRPVSLANGTGRQLFIVQEAMGYIALLEFKVGRFRASVLGKHSIFGGVEHRLHHPAGSSLLEVVSTYGNMGAGRGASGEATTTLQLYDLDHDQWLLNAPVGYVETYLGYEDEEGENPSQNLEISRYYRVLNQGRTVVLGYYRVDNTTESPRPHDSTATLPPPLGGNNAAPAAPEPFPPGTYRLVAGRYELAK